MPFFLSGLLKMILYIKSDKTEISKYNFHYVSLSVSVCLSLCRCMQTVCVWRTEDNFQESLFPLYQAIMSVSNLLFRKL